MNAPNETTSEPFLTGIGRCLPADWLMITCGLPSTCKTGAAVEICRMTGAALLRTDLIRREILPDEIVFNEKEAADPARRNTVYEAMFQKAGDLIRPGIPVIMDATFVSRQLRARAAELAVRHRKTLVILETVCPTETALWRITNRSREDYESNALTEAAYRNNQQAFEVVDVNDLKDQHPGLDIIHLTVDTGRDRPEDWLITGFT
jgi:predicted kinase